MAEDITKLTNQEREYLIEQSLETQEGRQALAASMANPIRITLPTIKIRREKILDICWNNLLSLAYSFIGIVKIVRIESTSRWNVTNISSQRLQREFIRKNEMIQSDLYRDVKSIVEIFMPSYSYV